MRFCRFYWRPLGVFNGQPEGLAPFLRDDSKPKERASLERRNGGHAGDRAHLAPGSGALPNSGCVAYVM
ncbi:hypothetical protein KL925_002462 [Ogataea polymorpha]|nr:hypothetical protein KL908_002082 [Ogataea polymorpha]KAG7899696.1 hypothetical protein KL935_003237 [Ogataea polymorpha]KAG7909783.1 hypothetical protein KL906_001688 [Ogataea polymorpha]KAG7917483.1 hypothetical protein KL927_002226 [Ogataea polymorpha]KAG7927091.1 hypothetical protein KL925_002462 [Ogataea polymorpha]